MAARRLPPSLRNAFATEFCNTILNYSAISAAFCDFLLKVINIDIHAVNLSKVLNETILAFQENKGVHHFLSQYSYNMIDLKQSEEIWLGYYIPRIYVFLNTTTFDGSRIDGESVRVLFDHLLRRGTIPVSPLRQLLQDAETRLTLFGRKCRDENWYYGIDDVLDAIARQIIIEPKQNTVPLFYTIMKAIEPKFIDNLRENFGRRMSITFMLEKDTNDKA